MGVEGAGRNARQVLSAWAETQLCSQLFGLVKEPQSAGGGGMVLGNPASTLSSRALPVS